MSPWLSELVLRSQSDERLVSLARAGNDRAFAAIVQRYRPELLALARRLNSDGRAEDLLQQAFLSAFAALRSGADVKHLRGWLYQIVRNAASKSRPSSDVPLDDIIVAAGPVDEVVQHRVKALSAMSELARLPERQRTALVGTALNGRAHSDVAASMGVSEQAVRQLVHRARTTLRGAVTALTPWPLARWLTTATPPGTAAPEIAAAAGAVSSTGAVVKLGALFAATGVFATGVAAGPVRHERAGHPAQAAAAHVHASSRVIEKRPAIRPSTSTASTSERDRGRAAPGRTARARGGDTERRGPGRRDHETTAVRREAPGSPRSEDHVSGSSARSPETERHDGSAEGASVAESRGGSGGHRSTTSDAAQRSDAQRSAGDDASGGGGDATASGGGGDATASGGRENAALSGGGGRSHSDSSSPDSVTTEGR